MKSIPLREIGGLKSTEVFTAVLGQAPNGLNIAQIRARCRVLDAMDGLMAEGFPKADALHLEDADHATLKEAIERHQFGGASKALLRIIDDVLGAA